MLNLIKEEFEDTKEIIRIRKSKKDRQHNGYKKKDRQHNGYKKKDRQHNGYKKKDRQHNGQKKRTKGQQNKDRAIRTPLKQEVTCCVLLF